jgi:hypothetical protein
MNYDPNICRNFATHTVKLTFGQWTYRAEHTVKVGGNCSGLQVIKTAVNILYDKLPDNGDGPEIRLTNLLQDSSGKDAALTVAQEDGDDEFLHNILIGAEIIALEPDQG